MDFHFPSFLIFFIHSRYILVVFSLISASSPIFLLKYYICYTIRTSCFIFPYLLYCLSCLFHFYLNSFFFHLLFRFVRLKLYLYSLFIHLCYFFLIPSYLYLFPIYFSFFGFFSFLYICYWSIL